MSSVGGFFGNPCDQFAIPITIPDFGVAYDALGHPFSPGFIRSTVVGFVTRVRVRITNFSHQYPDDVNILLTKCDPIQQRMRSCVLMANAGATGTFHVENINFTIDDGGIVMPDARASLVNGAVYKPGAYLRTSGTVAGGTAYNGDPQVDPTAYGYWAIHSDTMAHPPNNRYGTTLAEFNGVPAQGCWAFWIHDDQGLDSGSIGNIELLIDAA